jgi:hypothetical protein
VIPDRDIPSERDVAKTGPTGTALLLDDRQQWERIPAARFVTALKKRDDPALRQCNMSMQGTSATPILGWSASDSTAAGSLPEEPYMMRAMFRPIVIVFALAMSLPALGADQRAKTEDGRDVILHDDGTWSYAKPSKTEASQKDRRATEIYRGKHGTFTLSLIPGVWKKSLKPSSPAAEVEFTHKDGDAMAMVIAERIAVSPAVLKETVLKNARNADPEAKIIKEEKRTVNGSDVTFLTINAKVQGIPFTYMYDLYTGDAGTIQILTFTGQNLVNEYRADIEALLNGFEVLKK